MGTPLPYCLKGKEQKKLRLAEVDCPEKDRLLEKMPDQFTSDKVFGKPLLLLKQIQTVMDARLRKYTMTTENTCRKS